MLEIYAGKTALETIQAQGFSQDLFTGFLGASGGPKWFTLFSLDKFIFGEFFKNRTEELNLVGSSAGAFRAACFGQNDPVAAISRLAKHYSETVYSSEKPTAQEITEKARDILDITLGEHGVAEIINNPIRKAHFVVAKSNGFVASENKLIQGAGLVSSFVRNRINRRLLNGQYERFIFQPQTSKLALTDPDDFATTTTFFTSENLKDALLASGSIPMVMEGIANINGCPEGMYRDGGIVDYHFDLKFHNPGLVLYPHFSANLKAGWFDKNLKRPVREQNYDNVVVICPSKEYISKLPNQKIPDRNDFTDLDADTRIKDWRKVMTKGDELVESFEHFISTQNLERIKPISVLINN